MPGMFDPESIKWPTVGRYAAGGALTGGSMASVMALLHMLQQASEERKREQSRGRTSEDTIVLTLPRSRTKRAEDFSEPGDDSKAVKVTTKGMHSHSVNKLTAKGQLRHFDGEFGARGSVKRANWQTLATSIIAALGGGAAGYSLVDKIYNNRRMAGKSREAEQAQQEYLDMLRPKTAAESPQRSFNRMDYPLAFAALSLMLGAGGTAYLTKRILDEYSSDTAKSTKDPMAPQVRRIVFKTAESDTDPEAVSEKIAALVGVYLDICSGKPDILGDERCAEAIKAAGADVAAMYKSAAYGEDYGSLLATMDANPQLRQLIQRVAAERHPVLRHAKWLLKLPGFKGMADRKLYEGLDQALGPKAASEDSPGVRDGTGPFRDSWMRGAGGRIGRRRLAGEKCPIDKQHKLVKNDKKEKADDKEKGGSKSAPHEKQAGFPVLSGSPAMLGASILGSGIAENAAERGRTKAIGKSRQSKQETPDQRARRILSELTIATADPNAAEFVNKNQAKLKELLKALAVSGRI